MNKPTLYMIPGMGNDERLFDTLIAHLPDYHCIPLGYNNARHLSIKESAKDYVSRLFREHQVQSGDIIIGMSLGGILAVEAADLFPLAKVIIVSSVKHSREIPRPLRIFRYLPLHLVTPPAITRPLLCLASRWMIPSLTERALLKSMVYQATDEHFFWGRNTVIHWQRTTLPDNLIGHIHGTQDHIFYSPAMKNVTWILEGTHWMIVDKASAVAKAIINCIEKAIT